MSLSTRTTCLFVLVMGFSAFLDVKPYPDKSPLEVSETVKGVHLMCVENDHSA